MEYKINNTIKRRPRLPCILPTCHGQRFELVHKFPCNNKRAERWLQVINQPKLLKYNLDIIRKRMFICYRHFREQDYKNKESRILNKTAVPSLLLLNLENPQNHENNSNQTVNIDLTPDGLSDENIHIADDRNDTRLEQSNTQHQGEPEYLLDLTGEYLVDDFENVKETDVQLTPGEIKSSIPSPPPPPAPAPKLLNNVYLQQKEQKSLLLKNATPKQLPNVFLIKKPINNLKKLRKLSKSAIKLNRIVNHKNRSSRVITKISMPNQKSNNVKNGIDNSVDGDVNLPKKTNTLFNKILAAPSSDHQQENCQIENGPVPINAADDEHFLSDKETEQFISISSDRNELIESTNQNIDSNHWSDDHKSEYDIFKLYEQQFKTTIDRLIKFHKNNIKLWTKSIIENTTEYARVSLIDYLNDKKMGAHSVVASLVNYGFAFIENVPANMSSTEIAIKHLFSVQKTLFGEMFTLTSNKYHADSAYQQGYLPAHTDNTYFNNAAGLIALHCTKHLDCVGGESLLLDGFKVLQDFLIKYPDSYKRLCETSVPAIYLEEKQNHQYSAPIIRLNPITKLPEQIRFNLSDRSNFNTLPQEKMFEFYQDLRLLTEMIQTKSYEWWFKLVPGTVMIFNNWRLLHGRKAFTGQRVLNGCYISQTEFQSVARHMGLLENN